MEQFCEDEGCPHHGTKHICVNSQLALPAGPVPEGWKLVPKVPDETMLNAARDWSVKKYGIGVGNDGAIGCYGAMYDAAPQPPSPAVAQPVADELMRAVEPFVELAHAAQDHDMVAGDDSERCALHVTGAWSAAGVTNKQCRDLKCAYKAARAALGQPVEESKKSHEWATLRFGSFDVFNGDNTVHATVFNSLDALIYLKNGFRVEEQKLGKPAEEGKKE